MKLRANLSVGIVRERIQGQAKEPYRFATGRTPITAKAGIDVTPQS